MSLGLVFVMVLCGCGCCDEDKARCEQFVFSCRMEYLLSESMAWSVST